MNVNEKKTIAAGILRFLLQYFGDIFAGQSFKNLNDALSQLTGEPSKGHKVGVEEFRNTPALWSFTPRNDT